MNKTLVLLAAGLGSRYGSCKQIDGVGPNGEMLMEYAIFDAVRAGFDRIVFIIKPDILPVLKSRCADALSRHIEVCYAFQTQETLEGIYTMPAQRKKPLGTVHALWCARSLIDTPFAVLNADDYYGRSAFVQMAQALDALPEQGEAVLIGYPLENTLSPYGTVTRGVCREKNGVLTGITETYHIAKGEDGLIRDQQTPGAPALMPHCPVSMNFWGFTPWILDPLDMQFKQFLSALAPNECRKEYQLPTMVGDLICREELRVQLCPTDESWFGMTYQPDRAHVREKLAAMHAQGYYPANLQD